MAGRRTGRQLDAGTIDEQRPAVRRQRRDEIAGGFEDRRQPSPAFFGAMLLQRIADGAFQQVGGYLGLDEIVGRARLHRLDIDFVIALAGQQDQRAPVPARAQSAHQVDAVGGAEAVINQADIVLAGGQPCLGLVDAFRPVEFVALRPDVVDHIPDQHEVIPVVLDQQYANRMALRRLHALSVLPRGAVRRSRSSNDRWCASPPPAPGR
jgi:hypothetical protein